MCLAQVFSSSLWFVFSSFIIIGLKYLSSNEFSIRDGIYGIKLTYRLLTTANKRDELDFPILRNIFEDLLCSCFSFLKIFFFLERGKGREKEKERNINV